MYNKILYSKDIIQGKTLDFSKAENGGIKTDKSSYCGRI